MGKKRSDKKRKPQQRRPAKHLRAVPSEPARPARDPAEAQPLLQGLRRALRSQHPLDLLVTVSQLMTVTDPRTRDPFARDDPGHATLETLVESFVGVEYAETTAALRVIRAFTSDEIMAARIGKELRTRHHPMPAWLEDLDRAEVTRTVEMTHVLGDGDDYFLQMRLPSGHVMTALVYVDHNLGTVVKDAFVLPESFDTVEATFREKVADPDTTIRDADPADVRAMLTSAIEWGARTYPPLETDEWPDCRPLVEWMVGVLPAGGRLPERPEWSDEELSRLGEEFFGSAYGAGLDTRDARGLLRDLTWFGTDYGPGDPLRWSPVNVEILLVDWLPRKIVAEVSYLAQAPAVLRGFVEFCHAKLGIRRELTAEVLAAVNRWEPEYQRLIRSSRPQGPAALAATVLGHEEYDGFEGLDQDESFPDTMLRYLDLAVGGRFELMRLDSAPLPDEPFEWAGVPDDVRDKVREVLEECDRCADELFDVEHRTAFRRFLSRAAVGDPGIFRRRSSVRRAAAAVCWAVAKANATVGHLRSPLESRELLAWFDVQGSISQRAEVFLRAVGVEPYREYGEGLGSPDYLVSARREQIIETRDRYLAMLD